MRLLRALLGATVLLALNSAAHAQIFTQLQWGINRGAVPSPFCVMSGTACSAQIGTVNGSTFVSTPAQLVVGNGGTFIPTTGQGTIQGLMSNPTIPFEQPLLNLSYSTTFTGGAPLSINTPYFFQTTIGRNDALYEYAIDSEVYNFAAVANGSQNIAVVGRTWMGGNTPFSGHTDAYQIGPSFGMYGDCIGNNQPATAVYSGCVGAEFDVHPSPGPDTGNERHVIQIGIGNSPYVPGAAHVSAGISVAVGDSLMTLDNVLEIISGFGGNHVNGINLTGVTWSGYPFASPGFKVDGNGNSFPAAVLPTFFVSHAQATGLVATGTNQATALAINHDVNVFSTVASGTGTVLDPTLGITFTIFNGGANNLAIYPPTGAHINSLSTNAAYSASIGSTIQVTCISATTCIGTNITGDQLANSVLGNATAGAAAPAALAVPSCSAATSALTWTTSSGFGCNTLVAGVANPTASVGLTAVNGTATTAMRSDAAPALSQAIVPTWTGTHTFAEAIVSTKATGTAPFTVASTTQVSNLFATKAATANAWTTARNLAGNSVDGSANVAFANKFIVQGTTDAGLSAAQFLGALGTGLVKNTTTTGVLSIATAGTDYLTSVGASFTGGLISVGSSPLTANGTLGFTVAGTSGGIPYFSSTSTWASSALLAANALMIGGGAGVAPSTTTTGTGVLSALGVNVGTAGAFVVNGGALGTPSSGTLSSATGLPISTGVSGLGTGIATALAVNTGSAGAPVLFNGAGGTPSSLTLTNATALPAASVTAGALANTMTATTQAASNNSTRLATTAYVDAQPVTAAQMPALTGSCTTSAGAVATTCEQDGAGTNFTPTLTCNTGTVTTGSASGRTKTIGTKLIFLSYQITITTAGTCSIPIVTLPAGVTAGGLSNELNGREANTGGGEAVVTHIGSGATTALVLTATGTNPAVNGAQLNLSGVVEIQ